MLPARVAIALQADRWFLRSDVVWSKPNPMPESVRDRPSRSHEYVFLLSKSRRYFYDDFGVREETTGGAHHRGITGMGQKALIVSQLADKTPSGWDTGKGNHRSLAGRYERIKTNPSFHSAVRHLVLHRTLRSVWTMTTEPFPEAHFATFPKKLAERCILAGTPPQTCEHCGAPWKREVKNHVVSRTELPKDHPEYRPQHYHGAKAVAAGANSMDKGDGRYRVAETVGWAPTCRCEANTGTGRALVLDLFCGAGTTLLVADRLGRRSLGIDASPELADMARRRIEREAPLFIPRGETVESLVEEPVIPEAPQTIDMFSTFPDGNNP